MATYKTFSETITSGNKTHLLNAGPNTDDRLDVVLIINDGPGDINVKFDTGTGTFGPTHVMKPSEDFEFRRPVHRLRVIHSGTDASYRAIAY